jgi:surfeit locus 1 family protein
MSSSRHLIIRLLPHAAALLVILMCARLAVWQFDRAEEKRTLLAAWQEAPAVSLDAADDRGDARYARIQARGRFDDTRQILLDNQIRNGQTGVHVFTPFRVQGQSTIWLVNRGWYPLPSRQGPLPEITASPNDIEITGRLVDPPRVGLQLGEARALDRGDWPQLVTYLDLDRVDEVIEQPLAARVILLDPAHASHLTGDDWQPVNFGPDRHLAYAWQWITMAVVVFLIWVFLTWRSLRRS